MRKKGFFLAIFVVLLGLNSQVFAEQSDPMDVLGIGLKVGYLHYGKASFNLRASIKLPDGSIVEKSIDGIPTRGGLLLSIPINFGGGGFGWIFDPYFGFGETGSYGIYLGPTITFHPSGPLYFGFGFGPRFGVVTANFENANTSTGFDIYGRVPIDITWYLARQFGLVFELGIGYGVTLFKPTFSDQQLSGGVVVSVPSLKAGSTYQLDFSAGFRFP